VRFCPDIELRPPVRCDQRIAAYRWAKLKNDARNKVMSWILIHPPGYPAYQPDAVTPWLRTFEDSFDAKFASPGMGRITRLFQTSLRRPCPNPHALDVFLGFHNGLHPGTTDLLRERTPGGSSAYPDFGIPWMGSFLCARKPPDSLHGRLGNLPAAAPRAAGALFGNRRGTVRFGKRSVPIRFAPAGFSTPIAGLRCDFRIAAQAYDSQIDFAPPGV
jgi:hypothetical protein